MWAVLCPGGPRELLYRNCSSPEILANMAMRDQNMLLKQLALERADRRLREQIVAVQVQTDSPKTENKKAKLSSDFPSTSKTMRMLSGNNALPENSINQKNSKILAVINQISTSENVMELRRARLLRFDLGNAINQSSPTKRRYQETVEEYEDWESDEEYDDYDYETKGHDDGQDAVISRQEGAMILDRLEGTIKKYDFSKIFVRRAMEKSRGNRDL